MCNLRVYNPRVSGPKIVNSRSRTVIRYLYCSKTFIIELLLLHSNYGCNSENILKSSEEESIDSPKR
jgi:hypothetical protein